MDKNTAVVILAAGNGTRMRSDLPKVLHKAAGRSLVEWVVCAAKEAGAEKPIVVYGAGGDAVPNSLGDCCRYALQAERKGSGHAVMVAADAIAGSEYTVILAGDMPLVKSDSIAWLADEAKAGGYSALLLTGMLDDPTGYGRILRDANGGVCGIVEQKDATEEQKAIKEVNISFYCFRTDDLLEALKELTPNNAQNEYYLTDCINIIYAKGKKTGGMVLSDLSQCEGVNTRVHLAKVTAALRARINNALMEEGVTMIDPASTYIDAGVSVGQDTVIYPGVVLEGATKVGRGCTLYQGSRICDSVVEDGATVQNSVVLQSRIGAHAQVGPYAYIRPGTDIGAHCRIGDFVETKNATIADYSKVSHLSYVGDADVGSDVNIGCGVVFVNYDGKVKARTKVGDKAFIGCNTNLISPVEVGDGAYIAAGATITKDIPADALCIARSREVIKDGWGKGRYNVKEHKED
ncbi:MAG: bifunctional UDP-N-acetylglucosamine diphosphorylase/glucosamine-1-phosphate N-acetyltransferase GlmU [Christensenellaceae bacterium]|nr:bifunctional UDP-N-acetylglucosamine diphosphorylase/glucosamine-1-phosphate N-acetyltransferase GlmU [Christensenellaceae bacterium]